jgi:mercuric ion transport protein
VPAGAFNGQSLPSRQGTAGRSRAAADPRIGRMSNNRLLNVGIVGTIVAALCCFTPVLAVLLAITGLSALLGWLDYVLLPALAFFLVITGYALWQRTTKRSR